MANIIKNLKLDMDMDEIYVNKDLIDTSSLSEESGHIPSSNLMKKEIEEVKGNVPYSAFEVFVTDKTIPAGMVDSNDKDDTNSVANFFDFDNTTATGLEYTEPVPPTPDMKVQIDIKAADNGADVKVDWGDGTVQSYDECYDGEKYIVHTYEKSGKYIIKVYGNFCAFRPKFTKDGGDNPISRIWEMDLPMTDTLWNLYSLCEDSYRILKVKVPEQNYMWPTSQIKISRAFSECRNLLSFEMGKNGLPNILQMDKLFTHCHNITSIIWDPEDFGKFPRTAHTAYSYLYQDCPKLSTPLARLVPSKSGWSTKYINMSGMFAGDVSIPPMTSAEQSLVSSVLWNSTYNTFDYPSGCFKNCSDALRAQIPTTWGGDKA